jgi:hypothetical protein
MVIRCWTSSAWTGYVPKLQVGGQIVTFLHDHRGMPIASSAVFEQIGTRFRRAVARFADSNDITVIKFKKGIRKAAVMEPLLRRAARAGRSRVVAIGWAQEFQLVWEARKRDTDPAKPPQFSFAKAERRVTCYYFYVWDESWGPGFIKVCAYFPYPVKVWLNGHEHSRPAAARAGIGFTDLSSGFARCDDPGGLQLICDRLGPGDIQAFFDRWMSRILLPLTHARPGLASERRYRERPRPHRTSRRNPASATACTARRQPPGRRSTRACRRMPTESAHRKNPR